MEEIIKDIIIPIVTSFIGAFLGGITYNSYKYKKEINFSKISGNNSKMINGDNHECKIRKDGNNK